MSIFKGQPKLFRRIFWSKMIGLIISVLTLIIIALAKVEGEFTLLLWGFFFWYPTIGGIVGIMGIIDRHPLLNFGIYMWRSILVGAFMNMMLLLIAFEPIRQFTLAFTGIEFGTLGLFIGFMLEGAIIAGFIDYITTQHYGEGADLLKK